MSEMGHKHRISVLLSPAFMSEMAAIPTEFCAPQRKSLSASSRHYRVAGISGHIGALRERKSTRDKCDALVGWCRKAASGRAP